MSTEPESLTLQLLREMRADIARLEGTVASKDDIRELQSDFSSLRTDVAADVLTLHKELGGQIVGLRRAVVEYHTSVIGHGVLISELEARLRRVEQHLNLPEAH